MWKNVKSAFNLWNLVRSASSESIRRQAALPVTLTIAGDIEQFTTLTARLGSPTNVIHVAPGTQTPEHEGVILVNSDRLVQLKNPEFDSALGHIAIRHADRRIALAASVPAFRSVIVNQISHERAFENGKFAALSALPGVLPLTDWLLPATSAGDLYILTKNQIILLLEVAACYGHPPNLPARLKELLPVVGGAFGWRAIARELIGLVPGGFGVAIKAAVAYAATYSVGKAAAYYYAGNAADVSGLQLTNVYKSALVEAFDRAKRLLLHN